MRRSRLWLLFAFVLLGLAAILMSRGDAPRAAPATDNVSFPRKLRAPEVQRMVKRQVLPARTTAEGTPAPHHVRDPLLAALSGDGEGSAVVIEANALRHSPVGELLIDCLRAQRGEDPLSRLQERTGVDVLKDLDRIAMSGDTLLLSGHFSEANWAALEELSIPSAHGEASTVYSPRPLHRELPDGGSRTVTPPALGVWKEQLVVVGKDVEEVKRALDRVEGRGEPAAPRLREDQTYGEVYGVLAAKDLARLVPEENQALVKRLAEVAQKVELHLDARGDVGLVANVEGEDPQAVSDLGKSMGAALAVTRLKLQAQGEEELAQLMDLARIRPQRDGRFALELAMPLAVLEEQLAWCRNGLDGGAPPVDHH